MALVPHFLTSLPQSNFPANGGRPISASPDESFFQRRIAALLKLYCVRSRCQPDARRVGGGRGRASPPPTARFEAPVAEALVVETARVSSSCWRSSSAAAMWGALEIKVFNQEGRPRKVHVRIYLSINPATNLTTVSSAPPQQKTVVKFVAVLTERYKKTRAFDVQPS